MQNSFGKMAPALLLSGPVNKEMEVPTRSSRVPSGRFDFCAHPRAPCRDPAPATAPPAPGTRLLSPGLRKAAGPVSFPPLGVSPPCLPPGFVPGHPRRAVSAPLAPAGPSTRVPGAAVGDPSVAGGGDEIQGKRPGSRPASPPPPPSQIPGAAPGSRSEVSQRGRRSGRAGIATGRAGRERRQDSPYPRHASRWLARLSWAKGGDISRQGILALSFPPPPFPFPPFPFIHKPGGYRRSLNIDVSSPNCSSVNPITEFIKNCVELSLSIQYQH